MKCQLRFAFILALLIPALLQAQDFSKTFKSLQEKNDTAAQAKLLQQWEKEKPTDPEMFIAYFNYYVQMSTVEGISIDQDPYNKQSFQISDTGSGKPVAYLNFSKRYNTPVLQKGFAYIDRGIALYPNRLDMRFGKIYMLGESKNFRLFTSQIVETTDYGNTIKDQWLWKNGKPLENSKKFYLASMQDYIVTIYNTEDDDLLPLMREISLAVLKYNPDHVESLSNVALTYLVAGQHDKALEFLLKAEAVDPRDVVVLNNIAQAYIRKYNKPKAKEYLQKIIQYGTEEDKEKAKADLKLLGN